MAENCESTGEWTFTKINRSKRTERATRKDHAQNDFVDFLLVHNVRISLTRFQTLQNKN